MVHLCSGLSDLIWGIEGMLAVLLFESSPNGAQRGIGVLRRGGNKTRCMHPQATAQQVTSPKHQGSSPRIVTVPSQ